MDSDVKRALHSRFVLFSCEGTAEEVVIQRLYDDGLLLVSPDRVVSDAVYLDRPYTRTRKAADIANQYLGMDYAVDGAEGILIARIVDSRSPRFVLPRGVWDDVLVLSFFTRPEIEMLVIHKEGAYDSWLRRSRKDRSLKPSEFCKQELGLVSIKEAAFLKDYWSDGMVLANCIREHAAKSQRAAGELLLADLLA